MYNVVGLTLVVMATKFGHKITYNSACIADRPEMFAPNGMMFGDGRFNGTMQNVVGPTLVDSNSNRPSDSIRKGLADSKIFDRIGRACSFARRKLTQTTQTINAM